jgi:hypothetical protein
MRPQLLWTRRVLFPKAPLFEVSFLFLTSFFLLKLYTTSIGFRDYNDIKGWCPTFPLIP